MTKVLRILNRFNLGGPTFNVAYLTKFLEPDFQTTLAGGSIDISEGSSQFILDQLGIHPVVIPAMKREVNFADDIRSYYSIKQLIREIQPKIVHTHASKAGALGRMAAYQCKVPIIVHTFHGHVFHSYFGKFKTDLVIRTERFLAKRSTAIIAISEKQKSELVDEFKICDEQKVHIIPLGFDLTRFKSDKETKRKKFREDYKIADDTIVISIVGRLVPVKNHRFFIDAIIELKKSTSQKILALIVGDGELRQELEQYARDKSEAAGFRWTDIFIFTSWVSEIDEVNAGSDIIALTSLNEGTPVSLIEAQASGKPIVSTRVGGIENIVAENHTALLSPSGNLGLFSQNLYNMVNNNELRSGFAAKGWSMVGEKFHYERLIRDMRNLYETLLVSTRV